MKTVSIRQALTRFLENTDSENSAFYDEIALMRWARDADISIGGSYAFQRSSKLYQAQDNIITLDPSVLKVYKVVLGDHTDKDLYRLDEATYYATVSITPSQENYLTEYQLWNDISFPSVMQEIHYVIQEGKLILPIEFVDQEVTIFSCSYPKNLEGDIMVNENHINAIVSVIESKMIDKSIKSRKFKGHRIFNDDFMVQRDLRLVAGHEIKNARVKDREDNQKNEGGNNDIVSVLLQLNDYEY